MPADLRPVGGQTAWRRRSVLLASAVVPVAVVTGCSVRVGQPARTVPPPGPSPDELARGRAAADADALAAAALRTAQAAPTAAAALRTVAAQHRAHAAALRAGGAVAPATPTGRSSTPSAGSPAAALRALVAREQQAVTAAEADLGAVSGPLARLLASVAACRGVHVAELSALADRTAKAARS